jgi:RIO-like serine/threonine protein kinase
MKMVVMELLNGTRPWGESESENAQNHLMKFLATFDHENLVHGDLRPPNILFAVRKCG